MYENDFILFDYKESIDDATSILPPLHNHDAGQSNIFASARKHLYKSYA